MNEYPVNALRLEGLSLEWIVRSLKPGGRAFVIVPDGILGRVGGKKLRDHILRECCLDAIVSLPVRTFFANGEHAYTLAFTKKHDPNDAQADPVFTYLVSNIGERLTSVKREEIDADDLPVMERLFKVFASTKAATRDIIQRESGRCKVQDLRRFREEPHWVNVRPLCGRSARVRCLCGLQFLCNRVVVQSRLTLPRPVPAREWSLRVEGRFNEHCRWSGGLQRVNSQAGYGHGLSRGRSMTEPLHPDALLDALRPLQRRQLGGIKFRRQHPVEPYIVDFYCHSAKLVIELDGDSHIGRSEEDERRLAFLRRRGLQVLRFGNDDVLNHLQAVALTIRRAVGVAAK